MISNHLENNFNENHFTKYRFPIWLTIFFFLVFSIPALAFFGYILVAKLLGIVCLILVIVALRIWIRSARLNSCRVERIVLNKNEIFELERNYSFFKRLNQSDKQIIIHRTGLLLAELKFVSSNDKISRDLRNELAFNLALILMDQEYQNFNGLNVKIRSDLKEGHLSISDLPESIHRIDFDHYKSILNQSNFFDSFKNSSFKMNISS